jgi:hypothetical protein
MSRTDACRRLLALLDAQGARYRVIEHEPEGCTHLLSAMRGKKSMVIAVSSAKTKGSPVAARIRRALVSIIAALGLVPAAAVGISGVTYRGVVNRTREFAVRLALGAPSEQSFVLCRSNPCATWRSGLSSV